MTQAIQRQNSWLGEVRVVAGDPATFYLDPDLRCLLEYFGLLGAFLDFATAKAAVILRELETRPVDQHANSFTELDNDTTEEVWTVRLPGEIPVSYSFTCFAGEIVRPNGAPPDDTDSKSYWIIRPVSIGRGFVDYRRPESHAEKRVLRERADLELGEGEIIQFHFRPEDQKAMGGAQHNRWKTLLKETGRQFQLARDRLHIGPKGAGVASVSLVFPLPEEAKKGISIGCPKEWTVEVFLADLRGEKNEVRYNLRSGNHADQPDKVPA